MDDPTSTPVPTDTPVPVTTPATTPDDLLSAVAGVQHSLDLQWALLLAFVLVATLVLGVIVVKALR